MCVDDVHRITTTQFRALWRVLFLPYEGKEELTRPFDDLVRSPDTALSPVIHRVSTSFGTHLVTIKERNL